MHISLTKVIDPAQGSSEFDQANNGFRLVGAVFTLEGIGGHMSDNANNSATLIGFNGQTYTSDFNSIAGYTNFDSGDFSVSAGQTSVGAVTFQVPDGVSVDSIQWDASGGVGESPPAEWVVNR